MLVVRRLIAVLLVAALVQLGAIATAHDHAEESSAVLHAVAVDAHVADHGHDHHHHDDAADGGHEHDEDKLASGFHSHMLIQLMPPSEDKFEVHRLSWTQLDPPLAASGVLSWTSAPPFRPPRTVAWQGGDSARGDARRQLPARPS